VTIKHPVICPRTIYANLGRGEQSPDNEFAILWNPRR